MKPAVQACRHCTEDFLRGPGASLKVSGQSSVASVVSTPVPQLPVAEFKKYLVHLSSAPSKRASSLSGRRVKLAFRCKAPSAHARLAVNARESTLPLKGLYHSNAQSRICQTHGQQLKFVQILKMDADLKQSKGASIQKQGSFGWLLRKGSLRRAPSLDQSLTRTLSPTEIGSLLGANAPEAKLVIASGFLLKLRDDGGAAKRVKAVLVNEGLVWRHRVTRRILLTKDTISVSVGGGATYFELHGFAANPVSNGGKNLVHVKFSAASTGEAEKWVQGFRGLGIAVSLQEGGTGPIFGDGLVDNTKIPELQNNDGVGRSDLAVNPELPPVPLAKSGPPILIIVNPCSGHGKGARVLEHRVLPIFQLAGLRFSVIQTERAGHAVRLASEIDLGTCVGGIVCVGGDGLVNEVLNGLFLHPDRKRAMACPIGVVPAGSDNALVWSVLGVKTATDAAMLIVKGGTTPLDAFVVRWDPTADNAAPVPQIGVCMTYYGFMSDALRRSEMPRIKKLGPLKYTAAGAWQMLSLPFYNVDVEFLEVDQEERRAWWRASSGKGSMREAMEAADREPMKRERRQLSDWEERQQEELLNETQDEERRQQGIMWNVRARELGARWGKNEPPGKLLAPEDELLQVPGHKLGASSGFWRRTGLTPSCVGGTDLAELEGESADGVAEIANRPGHRHTFSAPAQVGAFDESGNDVQGGGMLQCDPKTMLAADMLQRGASEGTGAFVDVGTEDQLPDAHGLSKRGGVADNAPEPSLAGQPQSAPRDERGGGTESGGSSGSAPAGGWVRRSGPFLSVMVCNHKCRSAQCLKTQCLAPDAEADDGHLDLMLVKPVGRVDLVRFLTLLQFSKHVDLPYVEYRKVKVVRILPGENDNRSCGIDGELLPLVGPALMSVIPRLFNMMGRSQWDV